MRTVDSAALLLPLLAAAAANGCQFGPRTVEVSGSGSGGRTDEGSGGAPGSGGAMRIPLRDGGLIISGVDAQLGDDANCGVATVTLTKVPPDILILLDRSGSMADSATGNMGTGGAGGAGGRMGGRGQTCYQDLNCTSKWEDITLGLSEVVAQSSTAVNWGLKLFGTNGCDVSAPPEVPIAPDNAVVVNAGIDAAEPNSQGTPTQQAVKAGVAYLQTVPDTNPKFLLLATDGQPTCGSTGMGGMSGGAAMVADDMAAIQAVREATAAGFPTFVVGIATMGDVMANSTLSTMAIEGGQPRSITPPYYPVASRAELVDAFAAITKAAASCTLNLASVPPDPDNVGVRVNGDDKVPRDTTHAAGWDYGPGMTSIVLYGPYCSDVMSGTLTDVRALFGCPGVIVN